MASGVRDEDPGRAASSRPLPKDGRNLRSHGRRPARHRRPHLERAARQSGSSIEGTGGTAARAAWACPGTEIVVMGSASDDVGWLNCGAEITVLGDVTNGVGNAVAQGKLYVQGEHRRARR
ncbi:MAG: hypothetical protein MZW92_06385 [Comamonadaceae bacterium]|nr:hypothetical protein [Comamonadaceae bacterium]